MSEMTSGIADLISRLKNDGVVEGNHERERIVGEAHREADRIVEEARAKAHDIVHGAREDAEGIKAQLAGELTMASRDFVFRFQQRLKAQVIQPVVQDAVKKTVSDKDFLKNTLKDLCVAYAGGGGKSVDVTVSPEVKAELEGFFSGELKTALSGGDVSVSDEAGLSGFRIVRDGETFSWDFTEDAMTREIVGLVDPTLRGYFESAKTGG